MAKAKSKAQQHAAGAALAAKRGDEKAADRGGASKALYDSMSEYELEDMAASKTVPLSAMKDD